MSPHDAVATTETQTALYEALLHQQQFAVGVCDAQGVLTMMSPAMEEALGEPYSPTTETAWSRCYHLHDFDGTPLPSTRDPLARALRGERVADELISVRRPGGPVRFFRCNALRLLGTQDRLLGAVVFAAEITSRIVEQRRLDRLRDRLVGTINHEVRTPLTVVHGHLGLLEEQEVPESVSWSLAAIRRAAARLGEVADDISQIADESIAAARWQPEEGLPTSLDA